MTLMDEPTGGPPLPPVARPASRSRSVARQRLEAMARLAPSVLERTEALVQAIMGRFPRAMGLLILTAAVAIITFVLAGSIGLVILFAFDVSPQASRLWLYMAIPLWLAAAGLPLLLVRGGRISFGRGYRRLITRAAAGDRQAMWALVRAYLDGGQGLVKDPSQANWWLTLLADAGDAEAAFWLHEHHRKGIGTFRSEHQAERWLRQAAEMGHAKAKWLVGKAGQAGTAEPHPGP